MRTQVYAPTPTNLRRLAQVLRRGGLVAIPTETVYGLAADALDARACRAIFTAKGRPAHDPLIVHVLDLAQAEELAEFNPTARRVARRFWPGPLTLVLPKKAGVPGIVTSGGSTVAVRAPALPLARKVLRLAGIPLAAPSANRFGYISPTRAEHVVDGLGGRIGHVLDGGASPVGVESTVLDLTDPLQPRILRPGVVTAAMLARFLARPVRVTARASRRNELRAPGMLDRHYSPRTPLRLKPPGLRLPADVGGIFLREPRHVTGGNVFWFSRRGSLPEMARNLYAVLRAADRKGYRELRVEPVPPAAGQLAAVLRDRLQRAAARR